MKHLELLLRGVLAGLAIAAPVGPVNVLCMSRTVTKGRLHGIVSGLGAAVADTLYGSIAGFSITFVIDWLIRESFWIRLIGGFVLIATGIAFYLRKPKSLKDANGSQSAHSDFVTTLLLALTNPTTVISFLAVLAILGLGDSRPKTLTAVLVLGIFAGSMLWWVTLSLIAGHFRDRFDDRSVVWMNRIAAFAIGAFGVVTMLSARG